MQQTKRRRARLIALCPGLISRVARRTGFSRAYVSMVFSGKRNSSLVSAALNAEVKKCIALRRQALREVA